MTKISHFFLKNMEFFIHIQIQIILPSKMLFMDPGPFAIIFNSSLRGTVLHCPPYGLQAIRDCHMICFLHFTVDKCGTAPYDERNVCGTHLRFLCSQTCPVVSNICIYGEASRSFVVALVCPVPEKLRALADRLPNKADMEFEALCKVDTRPVLNKKL